MRAVLIAPDSSDEAEKLNKLLGPYGPLASNGARAQLAYCLGLIDQEELAAVTLIAKIRNQFAHRFEIGSFSHPEAHRRVVKLSTHELLDEMAERSEAETEDPAERSRIRELLASGRDKFALTVHEVVEALLGKVASAKRPDRTKWYGDLPSSTH